MKSCLNMGMIMQPTIIVAGISFSSISMLPIMILEGMANICTKGCLCSLVLFWSCESCVVLPCETSNHKQWCKSFSLHGYLLDYNPMNNEVFLYVDMFFLI